MRQTIGPAALVSVSVKLPLAEMVCPAPRKAGSHKSPGEGVGSGVGVGVTVAVGLGQGVTVGVGVGRFSARAVSIPQALTSRMMAAQSGNNPMAFCADPLKTVTLTSVGVFAKNADGWPRPVLLFRLAPAFVEQDSAGSQ